MKIAALIARILLGLVFTVFGVNGFLHFIPLGPPHTGHAGQWLTVLTETHYLIIVSTLQFIGGVLLLINRYATLGLVLLGPVIVNIVLFHALMDHVGLPIAIFIAVLWLIVAYHARRNLSGIFAPRIEP